MRQTSLRFLLLGVLVVTPGCGFGSYDDGAAPQVTSSNDGVAGAGPWWPWACPNGSNPASPSTPRSYTASGPCSDGGTFALSVDGCDIEGDWAVLGLADVTTSIPSSIPTAGGWEVTGTGSAKQDAGLHLTCDAQAAASGVLTLTCATGSGPPACVTTLTPVVGS